MFFYFCSDEFKDFFSKYGQVAEHEIIKDHVTKRPRGFGFIVFENEQAVDEILKNGNMIDMNGTQVSIIEDCHTNHLKARARVCTKLGLDVGHLDHFMMHLDLYSCETVIVNFGQSYSKCHLLIVSWI